ncbi:hypothetical protein O181_041936 [Austropuccinia psidii MF-1]|uniref:Uncharacterized protein n=1 Tax=Austropuccinia psidii MF-1 TaxID=1389203 RepID=A0A9Q3DKN2_9BASI|nr:hypothetical protein [Austropuccinia psidii MF-1]
MGIRAGDAVGYSIWFTDCSSQKAVLNDMTDGMLLWEIMTGHVLAHYAAMIIDESQLSSRLIVSSRHPRYSKSRSKLFAHCQNDCVSNPYYAAKG